MSVPCFPRRTLSWLALLLLGGAALLGGATAAFATDTAQQYLSGRGRTDTVPWQFQITAGRRAGEQTTIPVPSQWELHGFGNYHYGEGDTQAGERGLYRTSFRVTDPAWKDRRVFLVFEGVMTDATVRLNGQPAGPTHQGGFYQFRYDVTKLLRFPDPANPAAEAENLLEVDVAKVSAEPGVHNAEHRADYWVFGGIFRPVYLEAVPPEAISHLAVDARADGRLTVDVEMEAARTAERVEAQLFTQEGQPVGASFGSRLPGGGVGRIRLAATFAAPRLWTAETPHLYRLEVRLLRAGATLHRTDTRLGFRTVEVRPGEGIYINGQRVLLRGVNRHSFRPESGRTLDAADCLADIRLIQEMNMNAVRMSHYPPDRVFLDLCDELGLYVLDEIAGWQKGYTTEPARRLVRETVRRDVNHPSVIFWDNANEGGWNRAVDGDFALYDPQQRSVLHPWELFSDIHTKHYPTYALLTELLAGPHLVMPTEFLHGLFDGGHGASLDDYWTAIRTSPRGAGGFLWVLADEGVSRDDRGGQIDVVSTLAPDGLVGPRHEREGSFYTVRDLWSPVQVGTPALTPDARLPLPVPVENRYDFTSLAACRFAWALVRFPAPGSPTTETKPTTLATGELAGPAVAPGARGTLELPLPADWSARGADALQLTALDTAGRELWTWSWPTPALRERLSSAVATAAPTLTRTGDELCLAAGATVATFDAQTGQLRQLTRGTHRTPLTAGPRLVFARPATAEATPHWLALASVATDPAIVAREAVLFDADDATTLPFVAPTATITAALPEPAPASVVEVRTTLGGWEWAGFTLEISADGQHWRTLYAATRTGRDGEFYPFPPQLVRFVRLSAPHLAWPAQSLALRALRLGYEGSRFPGRSTPEGITRRLAHGVTDGVAWIDAEAGSGLRFRWTLPADGALRLDARYALEGEFLYHGLTFDLPEEQLSQVRRLGQGPSRVWQNRIRGTTLGVHAFSPRVHQPGSDWAYPETQGYFAGTFWTELHTSAGRLLVTDASATPGYLRVGTPRLSQKNTSPDFPAGDVSFLHAIPAIGTKFNQPHEHGPAGQPARATGEYRTTLVFQLLD